jgi:MFS family permease
VGATTLLTLFVSPLYFVVLPVHLKDAYGEAIGMGLLYSAFGGGATLGALAFGVVGRHVARRALFLLGAFGVALGSAATASLPPLPAILAGSAVVGLAFGPLGALAGVVTGERTPADLRGRVFGLVAAGAQLATPVGSLLAGFLLDVVSMQPLIAALATGCALVALRGLFDPALRRLAREDST